MRVRLGGRATQRAKRGEHRARAMLDAVNIRMLLNDEGYSGFREPSMFENVVQKVMSVARLRFDPVQDPADASRQKHSRGSTLHRDCITSHTRSASGTFSCREHKALRAIECRQMHKRTDPSIISTERLTLLPRLR